MLSGKEALINLSKTCMAYQEEFGRLKIDKKENEALQTLKEIVQKYDKYKRAFEILKPLMKEENLRIIGDTWTINQILYLSQEEYELLEELMK